MTVSPLSSAIATFPTAAKAHTKKFRTPTVATTIITIFSLRESGAARPPLGRRSHAWAGEEEEDKEEEEAAPTGGGGRKRRAGPSSAREEREEKKLMPRLLVVVRAAAAEEVEEAEEARRCRHWW
jgi:hypothetical protein